MVRDLMHDPMFLGMKSRQATKDDAEVARDLLDTLSAHRETCVGMAANMIGKTVRIIAFFDGIKLTLMYNPEIISKSAPFETEESCLQFCVENKDLHGLHGSDYPARNRPLQRNTDIAGLSERLTRGAHFGIIPIKAIDNI